MPAKSCKNTGPKCPGTRMFATFLVANGGDRTAKRGPSISSAVASRARTSATPGSVPGSTESVPVYGPNTLGSFAFYDRVSSSWRTWQLCLDGDSEEWLATWPVSGTTRNGIAFRLPPLVPPTFVSEFLLLPTLTSTTGIGGGGRSGDRKETGNLKFTIRKNLLPTLTANMGERGGKGDLLGYFRGYIYRKKRYAVHRSPTLKASDWKGSSKKGQRRGQLSEVAAGGQLNPTWCEWFMGFPLLWTELDALATP